MNEMKPSNAQKLGTFVQGAMERMENDLPDAELGEMMLICTFQREREDGTRYTRTRVVCTDSREYIQLGILRSATLATEGSRSTR